MAQDQAPSAGATDGDLPQPAQALLDAVVAISSDLDLHQVLDRIVRSACRLTQARYGALGVVGHDRYLVEFVTSGLTDEQRAAIGDLPRGHGILGLLIQRPEPIRLPRLQDHPASYGFPPHHPPMTSFLGVPVRVRGTVFGNLYLTEKLGAGEFTARDESLVTTLATAAGFVIENARAYALSERQRRWLEATADLNEALQPPVPLSDAFNRIALGARAATAALGAGVLRREPPARAVLMAVDGREASALPALVDRLRDQLAKAEASGRAVDTDLDDGRSLAAIPLRTHLAGSLVLLVLLDRGADRDLVESFADQAALALDRIQAWSDRAELALVSDRERIARDLHDVVIQRLFATGLQLRAVSGKAPDGVKTRIEGSVAELDTTISDIRSTIFALRDRDDGRLRDRVLVLIREYADVLGFTPQMRTRGPVDATVSGPAVVHTVDVLREALSNIARHAGATCATIDLEVDGSRLVLRVTDDGVGIPEERHESGLRNVRRRAADLGGEMWVAAVEPHGTMLTWTARV